jgi:Na+-driven multidrug efflux pump
VFGQASGAEGFWISLVVGLAISGLLMTGRLIRVSQP